MRSSWIVGDAVDISIPVLTIAIQSAVAMAIEVDSISTKHPRRRLILISNGNRVIQEVR